MFISYNLFSHRTKNISRIAGTKTQNRSMVFAIQINNLPMVVMNLAFVSAEKKSIEKLDILQVHGNCTGVFLSVCLD